MMRSKNLVSLRTLLIRKAFEVVTSRVLGLAYVGAMVGLTGLEFVSSLSDMKRGDFEYFL